MKSPLIIVFLSERNSIIQVNYLFVGHLIHRFNISEQDWHRIKLNIDSKCRTAHRRLVKGLPLTVKSFRGRSQPEYVTSSGTLAHELSMNPDDLTDGELHIHQVSRNEF